MALIHLTYICFEKSPGIRDMTQEAIREPKQRKYAYLEVIAGLFVAVLIISNVASTKLVKIGSLTFDGGTLLFPLSYIFGDVLTEVYGYGASRRVIWTGFISCILMSISFTIIGLLPADPVWEYQEAYEHILYMTPRIVIASIIAFFCGEFSNSFILARMKILTKGKHLWTRTIGSTLVGEGVDTIIFVAIAFSFIYPMDILIKIMLFNYVFKCGVEIAFTPVTYKIVGFLKRREHVDYFDYDTNFNPFRWTT